MVRTMIEIITISRAMPCWEEREARGAKPETRNPKPEGRPKSEIRRPDGSCRAWCAKPRTRAAKRAARCVIAAAGQWDEPGDNFIAVGCSVHQARRISRPARIIWLAARSPGHLPDWLHGHRRYADNTRD